MKLDVHKFPRRYDGQNLLSHGHWLIQHDEYPVPCLGFRSCTERTACRLQAIFNNKPVHKVMYFTV